MLVRGPERKATLVLWFLCLWRGPKQEAQEPTFFSKVVSGVQQSTMTCSKEHGEFIFHLTPGSTEQGEFHTLAKDR
jgi:hypothetical protein